jgi:hypothetical protein
MELVPLSTPSRRMAGLFLAIAAAVLASCSLFTEEGRGVRNDSDATVIARVVGTKATAEFEIRPHEARKLPTDSTLGTVTRLILFNDACQPRLLAIFSRSADENAWLPGGFWTVTETDVEEYPDLPMGWPPAGATAACAAAPEPTE